MGDDPTKKKADAKSTSQQPSMLLQLLRKLPEGEQWQYEVKWDGYRGIAVIQNGEARLWSRNERDLGKCFNVLVDPLRSFPAEDANFAREVVPAEVSNEGNTSRSMKQLRLLTLLAFALNAFGQSVTFTNIINVKSPPYSARGDGSTDDQVAIQAAYDACPAGGILHFPEGVYRHSTTLTTAKAITITGPGTLKELSVLAPQLSVTASNAVIDGLVLTGVETTGTWNSTASIVQSRCNIIVSGADCVIRNVVMSEKSCAIKVTGDRSRIFQCKASNSWLTRAQTNFHLSAGFILYNDLGGTMVGGTIEQCHSTYGYGSGIGIVGDELSVIGNLVTGTMNNGIYNSGGSRCKIIGNQVYSPWDNGITSRGSLNLIEGNTVKGSLADDASGLRRGNVGIAVTAYDFVAPSGSSELAYSTAMGANFNGFGNVIKGNTVSDMSVRGIELGRLSTSGGIFTHHTLVEGNAISNCGDPRNDESTPIGILVYGHSHRIIGNAFYTTLAANQAIFVTGQGWDAVRPASIRPVGVTITDNAIDGGNACVDGIFLISCNQAVVSQNHVERVTRHEIFIQDCTSPAIEHNGLPSGDIYLDGTPASK